METITFIVIDLLDFVGGLLLIPLAVFLGLLVLVLVFDLLLPLGSFQLLVEYFLPVVLLAMDQVLEEHLYPLADRELGDEDRDSKGNGGWGEYVSKMELTV